MVGDLAAHADLGFQRVADQGHIDFRFVVQSIGPSQQRQGVVLIRSAARLGQHPLGSQPHPVGLFQSRAAPAHQARVRRRDAFGSPTRAQRPLRDGPRNPGRIGQTLGEVNLTETKLLVRPLGDPFSKRFQCAAMGQRIQFVDQLPRRLRQLFATAFGPGLEQSQAMGRRQSERPAGPGRQFIRLWRQRLGVGRLGNVPHDRQTPLEHGGKHRRVGQTSRSEGRFQIDPLHFEGA